jgi:plastocyanin
MAMRQGELRWSTALPASTRRPIALQKREQHRKRIGGGFRVRASLRSQGAPVPRAKFVRLFCVTLSLLLAATIGCQESDRPAPKRAVTPLDPASVGTIVGEVQFQGPVPEQRVLDLTGFPDCAARHQGPVYAGDALVKDGKLQNVLVFVKQGLDDRVFAVPTDPVVINQEGCVFVPRVAGAQVDQAVRFLNSDPLAHNIHATPQNSPAWNFILGMKGAARSVTVRRPENVVELKCDIHPWMKAFLGVFDHPYFTVTGSDGHFELRNVPAGQYVIEAWHERFGTQTVNVTLAPKETKVVSFVFQAS